MVGESAALCVLQRIMNTTFHQLNDGWNAEPNAPYPKVEWRGDDLRVTFLMNPFQFPEYTEDDIGEIIFTDCSRYRMGTLNDEGWYRGQGRFTGIRHQWGEFYEVRGDLRLDSLPDDWNTRTSDIDNRKHYLFYFRDEDFECDAQGWKLNIIKAEQGACTQPSVAKAPSGG